MQYLIPGTSVLDELLPNSGYRSGITTTIFGPAASGKTTCCLHAALACTREGKKVLYLDTENGFRPERFSQLAGKSYQECLNKIILLNITSFSAQQKAFDKLSDLTDNDLIKLIVIDTLGAHYRVAVTKDPKRINKEMARQLLILRILGRNKIVLITNQVYADFEGKDPHVVGGSLTKKFSKCMISLHKEEGKRYAKLKKYAAEDQDQTNLIDKKIPFQIKERGMVKLG